MITDVSRPTTLKTRIIAHNQLVVRADRERRAHVDGPVEERIVAALRRLLKESDALVVSDYDKGAVTPNVLGEILPAAEAAGVPVLVDPKLRNFDAYRPATLSRRPPQALRVTNSEDERTRAWRARRGRYSGAWAAAPSSSRGASAG